MLKLNIKVKHIESSCNLAPDSRAKAACIVHWDCICKYRFLSDNNARPPTALHRDRMKINGPREVPNKRCAYSPRSLHCSSLNTSIYRGHLSCISSSLHISIATATNSPDHRDHTSSNTSSYETWFHPALMLALPRSA